MIKIENALIAFYGVMTVIVFILMITYGGLFDSVHSLLFREVSFIISPYSLRENITAPLYRIYNLDLLIFSMILYLRMPNIFAKVGAVYLGISALTGLLLLKFPIDPILLSNSYEGLFHIIVSSLTGIYIFIALILFSISFKKSKNFRYLSRFSFNISMLILLGGFLTCIFALSNLPAQVGFVQKLPIASFLLWVVITAVWMLKSDKRINYALISRNRRKK